MVVKEMVEVVNALKEKYVTNKSLVLVPFFPSAHPTRFTKQSHYLTTAYF